MKLNNFFTRAFFGALYVILLLAGILLGYTAFTTVFALITALSLFEFYQLIDRHANVKTSKPLNIGGGLLLFLATVCYFLTGYVYGYAGVVIYILILFISELYLKKENPIQSVAYSLFGIAYIALPLALAVSLVTSPAREFRFEYLLALFVFIWLNDTFAYLTGMMFGKHRLFERISPNKSWEGFFGGLIFASASSLLFYHFFPVMPMIAWIGFAVIVVIAGTLGDLFESLLKRTLGVKDSGNMIPGHGGILDRFDSTLFAIPAVFVYLIFLN